jgi:hypothetical protein
VTTYHEHIIERDDEPDGAVTKILVRYRVTSWGCAAQTYGPPEDCYPAEPIEIEVVQALDVSEPEWARRPYHLIVLRESEYEEIRTTAADLHAADMWDEWDA